MNELIESLVGKECIVSLYNGSAIDATVMAVKDGWLRLSGKEGEEIVSVDYVMRIREYPGNKKGRKKSVVV